MILLVGATIFASQWLMSRKPQAKRVEQKSKEFMAEIQSIELKTHQLDISGMGEIKAHRQLDIKPEISGRVIMVGTEIETGAEVREGQLLCQLDDRDLKIALQKEQANVAQQELLYLEELGRNALAKKEWESLGLENTNELEQQLAWRVPHLKKAKESLEAAKAVLTLAQLNLQRTEVLAPFDGVLVSWMGHVGSQVTPQNVLGQLLDHHRFDLELQLHKEQLELLPQRKNISVYISVNGNSRELGSLESILPMHHGQGRLVTALVSILNPLDLERDPIFVGSFVTATIKSIPFANSVVLPLSALNEQSGVWLCSADHKLRHQSVEHLPFGHDQVLITKGLQQGDLWVSSPLEVHVEGMDLSVSSSDSSSSHE